MSRPASSGHDDPGRYIHAIRSALGGYVVEIVDRLEEDETQEIVFTDLDTALDFFRDRLGGHEDPTTAIAQGAERRSARP